MLVVILYIKGSLYQDVFTFLIRVNLYRYLGTIVLYFSYFFSCIIFNIQAKYLNVYIYIHDFMLLSLILSDSVDYTFLVVNI